MTKVSLKGVVVGGIADIVATNIVAIPVVVIAAARINLAAMPKAQQTQALLAAMHASPMLYWTQMGLGALCSVLGGYVAARVAKGGAVLNGALSAFLCVGTGLYALFAHADRLSPEQHVLFLLVSPVLGALGGHLWQRRANRSSMGTLTSERAA